MTLFVWLLLALAAIYVGTIEAAFSALMRLSLRLMAERGGRSDRLGHYLDDPLQLFVPLRLLLGICIVAAGVLIARVSDVRDATSIAVFVVSLISFVVVCEHVLPMLIVRRDPEQALDLMLPVFHVMARALLPVTLTIIRIFGPRRDRESGNGGNGQQSEAETPPSAAESPFLMVTWV